MPMPELIGPTWTFDHMCDLNVSNCYLGEKSAPFLSAYIISNPYLHILNISDNKEIGVEGFKQILKALG